jgi:hypothetical protein
LSQDVRQQGMDERQEGGHDESFQEKWRVATECESRVNP